MLACYSAQRHIGCFGSGTQCFHRSSSKSSITRIYGTYLRFMADAPGFFILLKQIESKQNLAGHAYKRDRAEPRERNPPRPRELNPRSRAIYPAFVVGIDAR